VAGQLGYCGLDRGRQPLTGDEIRGCWEGPTGTGTSVPLTIADARAGEDPRPSLEFVEVGASASAHEDAKALEDRVVPSSDGSTTPSPDSGWVLWGDLEP
jgi:hypothetical protein